MTPRTNGTTVTPKGPGTRPKYIVRLGLGLAGALLLTACGASGSSSSSTSTGTGSTSTGTGSTSTVKLTYAQSQVKKFTAEPSFTPTGSSVKVKALRGDAVESVDISSQIPFCTDINNAMQSIATSVGITFNRYRNNGTPAQWAQGIQQGITNKVNALSLQCGIPPGTVAPQLTEAVAHHIPVALSVETVNYKKPADIASVVSGQYAGAAKLMVDYAIAQEAGKPVNALVVTANNVATAPTMVSAIKSEMSKYCGSRCNTYVVNVPSTEWGTQIQPDVESALRAHSNINWVLPIYDSMAIGVAPGIAADGDSGRVKIATYNGTVPILKMVKQGTVAADVDISPELLGYMCMDQLFRDLSHEAPLHNPYPPVRIIDKANVGSTGPGFTGGFKTAYVSGYRKLWGLG